ncbi:beta-phosphoglucomutase [Bacillus sp. JJ1532]|uniref:beta-phosphoglucomutase n=1 Tax=Bacillus sp. JJ1532 TaxID=3122958 RepID=UPI002FFFBB36
MKRTLQAVIFDMDGVIVDTFELYYLANKKIAEQLSVPFSRTDNEEFRGIRRMDIIESLAKRAKSNLSMQEKINLAKEKNKYYQELIESLDERSILPGMKDFITQLKKRNIKLAIASSSTNCITVLKKIGLIHFFDCIVDPSTIIKGKPNPEIFIKAAETLEIPHQNCVAIEDGEAGMKAIKSTKMFSIGIGNAVIEQEPDWYIDNSTELSVQELISRFEG